MELSKRMAGWLDPEGCWEQVDFCFPGAWEWLCGFGVWLGSASAGGRCGAWGYVRVDRVVAWTCVLCWCGGRSRLCVGTVKKRLHYMMIYDRSFNWYRACVLERLAELRGFIESLVNCNLNGFRQIVRNSQYAFACRVSFAALC